MTACPPPQCHYHSQRQLTRSRGFNQLLAQPRGALLLLLLHCGGPGLQRPCTTRGERANYYRAQERRAGYAPDVCEVWFRWCDVCNFFKGIRVCKGIFFFISM